MDSRTREVIRHGNSLFTKKRNLDSLWQEIAENFYPERADFTSVRYQGEEFSDHLYSSYPSVARRELANLVASSLRPRNDKWFSLHLQNEEMDNNDNVRSYLEYVQNMQWRAMYDAGAGFVRATKQADHDFVSFGNAVIKFGPNVNGTGLLFRNYHLRDCAWSENAEGKIDMLFRKWKPTARQLKEFFGDKVSKETARLAEKEPDKEVQCWHCVLPSRFYQYKSKMGRETPFVSLYIECEGETVLEEAGLNYFCYVVPRWHTISGSCYAVSMATALILPDGRTMQVMTRTIREAGEKYTDPPMIAVGDAIRGDIALYAGGVTIADHEYDERLGEVLRPVTQNQRGMPIGFEIASALKDDIRSGFFLDKIQFPETGTEMTAYEVRNRLREHIRTASPIFEPIEQDYNDPLCEGVFQVMQDFGAFPAEQMPEELSGQEVRFQFRSPMAEMAEQQDAEIFLDVRDRILMPSAQIDQAQISQVNWDTATRDAMRAAGFKAKWFNPIEAMEEKRQALAQAAQIEAQIQTADAAGSAMQNAAAGAAAVEGNQQ